VATRYDCFDAAGREFGNDPTGTANRRTDHPLARRGLYWRTPPPGHLFEIMTIDT